MPCYHPVKAQRTGDGRVTMVHSSSRLFSFMLPCGKCVGCKLEYSRQWAVRGLHEKKMHEDSMYLTLTFNDANVPANNSLSRRDMQLFLKRLRKQFPDQKLSVMYCGEYGEENGRPHYHLIIFGARYDDLVFLRTSPAGGRLFTSARLERIWPFGFSSVGSVTFESIAYVARYIVKKITGDQARRHYEWINPDTGEVIDRLPEFFQPSLRPAIGKRFLEKFYTDIFPKGEVIIRAKPASPPRYYKKIFKKHDPVGYEELQSKLFGIAERRRVDNSPWRLAVRERVTLANLNRFRRKL